MSNDYKIKKVSTFYSDAGFKIIKFGIYSENNELGYVKISWIPWNKWAETYPNIWEYLFRIEGWGGCEIKDRADLSLLTKEQIIEISKMRNNKVSFEEMEKSVVGNYNEAFEKFRDKYVDKPYIEYVYVKKSYRRQGIAKLMYIYVSHWLWDNYKLELRSGDIRTPDGDWLWLSILKKWDNIVKIDNQYKIKIRERV